MENQELRVEIKAGDGSTGCPAASAKNSAFFQAYGESTLSTRRSQLLSDPSISQSLTNMHRAISSDNHTDFLQKTASVYLNRVKINGDATG